MASKKSSKIMRRLESKKSHSWWWDSHISPKNSKWLQENLEQMDQNIKRMLKLIEEDGDSFAKKAEMYYQKRPELINLVEDFYRMYRSLAERYDNVTGELRKNIPSDLQSQGSGVSSAGSEPTSSLPSPRHKSGGPRAAGFGIFLGGGGGNVSPDKEGDESSVLDSESESDDSSSVNNYPSPLGHDGDHGFCEVKEKVDSRPIEVHDDLEAEVVDPAEFKKIQTLEDELRIAKEKLHVSDEEINSLRNELKRNENLTMQLQKDVSVWTAKFEKEKKEVSKLHDRIARYKTNLSERDQEIRGLKESISNSNKALSEENLQLQEEIKKLLKERAFLEDNAKEMDVRCQCLEEEAKRALAGKSEMEALLGSEIEQLQSTIVERNGCVEELKSMNNELNDEIDEMKKHLHDLHVEHVQLIAEADGTCKQAEELRSTVKGMEEEIRRQQETIEEGAEEKREAIRQLCFSLEHYRNGYHRLRQVFMGNKGLPVMAS
ncbi:unnamed protein product [Cuscuta campestris]|uniref:NAB domain-containing protein n=2 Tax=Cuscuta sect. Cleistogrammica TaxID=1824901 RepID=A0A484NH47_9ASTE|nr:hypothetical protein DM860_012087 [Cuscuta australis]VFR00461.1 unnamed protein product [Cuscuta campestris]